MQNKKQQLEPDMEQWTGSKLGKQGIHQGLFNLYAEYIMWNAKVDETQARIKIAMRNINNLRYADDTTVMAESEEELKNLLMKVKEESEKASLKLNIHGIWSHHFMANRWGKMETVTDFFGGARKSLQMVTAAMNLNDTYSLEVKLWPT